MFRQFITVLLSVLILCSFPLSMAKAEDVDCSFEKGMVKTNECAGQKYDTTKAELDAIYKEALAFAKKADEYPENENPIAEELLKKSQKIWEEYSEATCDAQAHLHKGPQEILFTINMCYSEMMQQRIDWLRNNFTEFK